MGFMVTCLERVLAPSCWYSGGELGEQAYLATTISLWVKSSNRPLCKMMFFSVVFNTTFIITDSTVNTCNIIYLFAYAVFPLNKVMGEVVGRAEWIWRCGRPELFKNYLQYGAF